MSINARQYLLKTRSLIMVNIIYEKIRIITTVPGGELIPGNIRYNENAINISNIGFRVPFLMLLNSIRINRMRRGRKAYANHRLSTS